MPASAGMTVVQSILGLPPENFIRSGPVRSGTGLLLSQPQQMVPEAGFEPARPGGRGIFVPLRLSPPPLGNRRRSWSGARLHPGLAAVGARRLLSTPSRPGGGLGSALARARCCPGRSPTLTGVTRRVSPAGLKLFQVPCVYRFHHSGMSGVRAAAFVTRSRGATINHPSARRQSVVGLYPLALSPRIQRPGTPSGYCAM